MMDNVFSNPAGMKVWGGNKGGIWRMVSKDEVVNAIVQGMERRAEMVVIPKANNLFRVSHRVSLLLKGSSLSPSLLVA